MQHLYDNWTVIIGILFGLLGAIAALSTKRSDPAPWTAIIAFNMMSIIFLLIGLTTELRGIRALMSQEVVRQCTERVLRSPK